MNPILDQYRASLGEYSECDLAQQIGVQSHHKKLCLSVAKKCVRGDDNKRTHVVQAWQCRARMRWARQELARMRQEVVKNLMQSVFGAGVPA